MTREKILVFLLRFSGVVMLLAWLAVILPVDWMVAIHAWLGLGPFPEAPITEYLTRSISILYAIEGGLLLVLATDVRRFGPVIVYLSSMHVLFGLAMLAIDLHAGLPLYWILVEGPPIAGIGAVQLFLVRSILESSGEPPGSP